MAFRREHPVQDLRVHPAKTRDAVPRDTVPPFAMAHPKRRISKHRKRVRRSHLALDAPQTNHCARCGSIVRTHRVCDNCGFYGFERGGQQGTEVLPKDEF